MNLENAAILTAMVTPFDEEGTMDYPQLKKLIEYLLQHHTEGLIVAGTTGESPTLSHDEKLALFKETIKIVAGRVPIICGIGSNNTQESVDFAKEVAQLDGVTAGLAVVPYYNKPNQEGLYRHFKAISEASDLPIILYNVPSRTIARLEVTTILELAKLPNIIGIKECTGQLTMAQIIEQAPQDFLIYSGEDALAFEAKAMGANGIISVASHVLGNEFYEMYQELTNGHAQAAGNIQRQLLPKIEALFSVPSPAPVKAVLNHLGMNVGDLRLPLVACTSEEKTTILKILNK